jgi:hypothetical protein
VIGILLLAWLVGAWVVVWLTTRSRALIGQKINPLAGMAALVLSTLWMYGVEPTNAGAVGFGALAGLIEYCYPLSLIESLGGVASGIAVAVVAHALIAGGSSDNLFPIVIVFWWVIAFPGVLVGFVVVRTLRRQGSTEDGQASTGAVAVGAPTARSDRQLLAVVVIVLVVMFFLRFGAASFSTF